MSIAKIHKSENVFIVSSLFDIGKLVDISTQHIKSLKSSSESDAISNLYDNYLPLHNSLLNSYSNWIVSNYAFKFETRKINGFFDDISTCKIPIWNKKILRHCQSDSLQYSLMFPKGTDIFCSSDNIFEKVKCFKSLVRYLRKYDALSNIYQDVNKYYFKIRRFYSAIEKKIEKLNADFKILDIARIKSAEMLYDNYLLLQSKFRNNPQRLEEFFNSQFVVQNPIPLRAPEFDAIIYS